MDNLRVVTFACDLYADIAPAWEFCWSETWPDCPYPLTYVTNKQDLAVSGEVISIPGSDVRLGWRIRRYVDEHCDTDLILIMMIDYLVYKVSPSLVEKAREFCSRPDIGHVRLRPMPHPQLPFPDDEQFGRINKTRPYALSLQPGIWKAELIRALCRDEENPWHTETRGSGRARRQGGMFICPYKPAIVHLNYYHKKKAWAPGVSWVMKRVPEDRWPDAAKQQLKEQKKTKARIAAREKVR